MSASSYLLIKRHLQWPHWRTHRISMWAHLQKPRIKM